MKKLYENIYVVFMVCFFLLLFLSKVEFLRPVFTTVAVIVILFPLVIILFGKSDTQDLKKDKKLKSKKQIRNNLFYNIKDRILLLVSGLSVLLLFLVGFVLDETKRSLYYGVCISVVVLGLVFYMSRMLVSEKTGFKNKRLSIIGAICNSLLVLSFIGFKYIYKLPDWGWIINVILGVAELNIYWLFMFLLGRVVNLKKQNRTSKRILLLYSYSLVSLLIVAFTYCFLYIKPSPNDFYIKLFVELLWSISVALIGIDRFKNTKEFNWSLFAVENYYYKFSLIIVVIRIGMYIKEFFHL